MSAITVKYNELMVTEFMFCGTRYFSLLKSANYYYILISNKIKLSKAKVVPIIMYMVTPTLPLKHHLYLLRILFLLI